VKPEFDWRARRVLVTGATGLVGGWLTEALVAAGADVAALVRDLDYRSHFVRAGMHQRCQLVRGSVEDLPTVERAVVDSEADTVFHLAAQATVGSALRSPHATFETNVRGTYNLLEACRAHRGVVKRIVVASSDKAYGDQQGDPYVEQAPLAAEHPYDVSKLCADMIAQTYARTYELPVVVARCGNIYGGGDLNWSRIVPGSIRAFLNAERPVVRSDGTYVRDYLYVRDAVSAYLGLAEQSDRPDTRGQAFNFSGDSPRTVLAIVERIAQLMGAEHLAPVIANVAENEIPRQVVSAARARAVLGWEPAYDLESGLVETIDWYRRLWPAEAPA
jgi:CDP-glucose 4,6-dehydratase